MQIVENKRKRGAKEREKRKRIEKYRNLRVF